jgi:hypothetical protein
VPGSSALPSLFSEQALAHVNVAKTSAYADSLLDIDLLLYESLRSAQAVMPALLLAIAMRDDRTSGFNLVVPVNTFSIAT